MGTTGSRPGRKMNKKLNKNQEPVKTVRYKEDELPPLTEQDYKELEALKKMPDSSIDYSDIPPLTKGLLKKGTRGRMFQSKKQ